MAAPRSNPPTRRKIARILEEAVPVVNEHAAQIEAIKAEIGAHIRRLDALELHRTADAAVALRRDGPWLTRLRWMLGR